jgi:hypothetical protein
MQIKTESFPVRVNTGGGETKESVSGAQVLRAAAKALTEAALRCEAAAAHFDKNEAYRGFTMALAAEGHAREAMSRLEMVSVACARQTRAVEPDEPTET